jgi:transitional endoplasmic reticulum ATPase
MGEEGAMQVVFDKAREMSPCVVIFEDLDSLITDQNRSFFLNQLDGFEVRFPLVAPSYTPDVMTGHV